MVFKEPVIFPANGDLATLPEGQAVYLIRAREGQAYLGRTNILRRRLGRLFAKWKLAELASHIEYWPTASRLEQWMLSYELAQEVFPDEPERALRLPKPAYVKLLLANPFARTQITTRLSGAQNVFFGPFSTRAFADQFESQLLDLFQLRRCQEDLIPSTDHPGCIYGEMQRCLRPCQQALTPEEYASEATRMADFLATRGKSTLERTALLRDRASQKLDFEQAAQLHARHDKIEAVARVPGELAGSSSLLCGVAVTASTEPQSVMLYFLRNGSWLRPVVFCLAPIVDKPASLDMRLRELIASLETPKVSLAQREQHLALLAKWFYSSWRDGEWLGLESFDAVPYRKLVNAIHRVAKPSR
jgi:excinuclease UvrABC nuclease subunit